MGILLAALIFFAVLSDHAFVYYLLVSLIVGVGVAEFLFMMKGGAKSLFLPLSVALSLVFPAYFYFEEIWYRVPFEGLIILILVVFSFAAVLSRGKAEKKFHHLTAAVLAVFFISLCFSFQINLRLYDGGGDSAKRLVFFFFAVVIMGDTFAYYFGSLFGKTKLAPELSPKKTIVGSVAAIFGNIITAIACYFVFFDVFSLTGAIAASLILGVTSQVGDLFESLIKRTFKVKDSSSLILGHGGVLDRIDSLLFSTPIFYFMIEWFKQI